jgi:hypothetical protein
MTEFDYLPKECRQSIKAAEEDIRSSWRMLDESRARIQSVNSDSTQHVLQRSEDLIRESIRLIGQLDLVKKIYYK